MSMSSKVVTLNRENQTKSYRFKFVANEKNAGAEIAFEEPSQFKVMSKEDQIAVTRTALSYFMYTPVYEKASSKLTLTTFVPESVKDEEITLVLKLDPQVGYSFDVEISDEMLRSVGQDVIALEIHKTLEEYEEGLSGSKIEEVAQV